MIAALGRFVHAGSLPAIIKSPMSAAHISETSTRVRLSDAPVELLEKIIFEDGELTTKRSLRELRQVCRVFDNVVKYRALEYVELPRYRGQIQEMLAKPTAFETSTQRVSLSNVRSMSAEEWKGLAKLLQRTQGIKSLRWVQQGRLHEDLVNALCSLPQLTDLELLIVGGPAGDSLQLPISLLSKLKTIGLHLLYLGGSDQDIDDNTKDAISYIVENGSALEGLEIEHNGSQPLILEGVGSLSSLRIIKVAMATLPTPPTALASLSQLSSLDISNTKFEDAAFWNALRASGVRLKAIKVEIPSTPLDQYLLSYQGLSSFSLATRTTRTAHPTDWMSLPSGWDEFLYRDNLVKLLQSGLLRHRATLHELRFFADVNNSSYVAVRDCQQRITGILHRFRALKRLDFIIAVEPSNKIDVPLTLGVLPALSTHIEIFSFTIVGLKRSGYINGQPHTGAALGEVLPAFERVHFNSNMLPNKWKTLRVVVKAFDPHHVTIPGVKLRMNRVVYRVVEDKESGKHGLRLDPVDTEKLNEEGARTMDESIIL